MLPVPMVSAPVTDAVATVRELALAVSPALPAGTLPAGTIPSGAPTPAGGGDGIRPPIDPPPPVGAEERAAWLAGLRQVINLAESAFINVLADFDAAGDGQALHGAASTQAWLRGALGMAAGEASERVRIARALRGELAPAMTALLDASGGSTANVPPPDGSDGSRDEPVGLGQIGLGPIGGDAESAVSYEHVRSIHRAVRELPPSARRDASEALTTLASRLGVDDLRAAGRHLRHVVDPDGSARHAEEDFGRRWLSLAPLLDGMHSIDGVLDAETAARLNTALAPFLVPTGPDDIRTTEQRRADGLAEIVQTAVQSGELPQISGSSVAMQVDVPLLTLAGESGAPARLPSGSNTPIWITPDCAQRLSCDASVRRLLLDPSGIPLDLGREVRVFGSVQRKALAARDEGCRFPGCGRPAVHTDAHHVVPWAQGGASDLSNGLLLCRFHHRQVHEGGWQIVSECPQLGANGDLKFVGPRGQRLGSPVPTARGPT